MFSLEYFLDKIFFSDFSEKKLSSKILIFFSYNVFTILNVLLLLDKTICIQQNFDQRLYCVLFFISWHITKCTNVFVKNVVIL